MPYPLPVIQLNTDDKIYLIKEVGEGFARYWKDGKVLQAESSTCTESTTDNTNCWASQLNACARDIFNDLLDYELYAEVKISDGTTGWCKLIEWKSPFTTLNAAANYGDTEPGCSINKLH
jgi:hypothetical protein